MSEDFWYAYPEDSKNPEVQQIAEHLETMLNELKKLPKLLVQFVLYINDQTNIWVGTLEKNKFLIRLVKSETDGDYEMRMTCSMDDIPQLSQNLRDVIYCGEDSFLYQYTQQQSPTDWARSEDKKR